MSQRIKESAQSLGHGHDPLFLKSRENLYRILETVPLGVGLLDASGTAHYLNHKAVELLGRGIRRPTPLDELAASYNIYEPGTRQAYLFRKGAYYQALKSGGEAAKLDDIEVQRPDGSRVLVEVSASGVLDGTGKLDFVVVMLRDITQQRKLEEERRQAERERRRAGLLAVANALLSPFQAADSIFNKLAQMVVPQLADGCVVAVSADGKARHTAVRHAEAEKQQCLSGLSWLGDPQAGEALFSLVDEQTLCAWTADPGQVPALKSLGICSAIRVPILGKGGSLAVFWLFSCDPRRLYTQQDLELAGELAAVTAKSVENSMAYHQMLEEAHARKKAEEEALRMNEERTRAIVESLLGGLISMDERQKTVEFMNPAALRMFGYSPAEILGRPIETLLPNWDRAWEGAYGIIQEDQGRRRDGSLFPLQLSVFSFSISGRGSRFLAAHVFDLSSRREMERLKENFVTRVSHELRTPLASIHGSLALLRQGVVGHVDAEAREVLEIAERNSNRLIALANDILDAGKMSQGKPELSLAACSVERLVSAAVDAVKLLAEQQDVTLECGPLAGRVWADERRMLQVLVNLLSNAIKFSPPKGRVTVSSRQDAHSVEMRVCDDGPGINPKESALIFEPFYQTVEGRKVQGGSGLGLAIAKTIVEQHGGGIGVESVLGKGSVFWVRLLLPPEAAKSPSKAGESAENP